MVYTYDERVIMEKLVEMGNANDIVNAIDSIVTMHGVEYEDVAIEALKMMADGVCEFYIALQYNGLFASYFVSESYAKAQKNAKRLFRIERAIGFDMYELPC